MTTLPLSKLHTPPNVYFDDSGCNQQWSDYLIWAGYWASYSFWQLFGNRWNRILDRPPTLPYWHQADARDPNRNNKNTPFKGLTDAQIARRELSLCKLIHGNRHRFQPLVVRVSHALVKAHVKDKIVLPGPLTKPQRAAVRALESPHFMASFFAAKLVVELQDRNDTDTMPVSLHFEERQGDAFQDHMLIMWKMLRLRDPRRMGTLDFLPGKSRDHPQLQASDMLAWHVNRRAQHKGAPDDPMWQLIKGDYSRPYDLSETHLKDHVADWSKLTPIRKPWRR